MLCSGRDNLCKHFPCPKLRICMVIVSHHYYFLSQYSRANCNGVVDNFFLITAFFQLVRGTLYTCLPHTVYRSENLSIAVCREEHANAEQIKAWTALRALSEMFSILLRPHINHFSCESMLICSFREKGVSSWDSFPCSSAWRSLLLYIVSPKALSRSDIFVHSSSPGAFNDGVIATQDLTKTTSDICCSSLASLVSKLRQIDSCADDEH